ncbi:MAG TPA: class I SAM-dependent methyltransferase [Bacteroidales bacterium]|nr:class I SAM-dependent methyltransferase [Bacteroidales bacterium]
MNNPFLSLLNRSAAVLLLISLSSCSYSQVKRVPVDPSEERLNSQHKPEQLMEVIGLEEGMVIADIGAGRGRMTVFFAFRVGEKGKVLANDIDKYALEYLENRCKRNNINNVNTFLGSVTDPMLPEGTADIVFMVSTFHHLEKPVELMRNTIPCLKPDGRLVIVERDPSKTGQSSNESTSHAEMISQMTEAGYELIRIDTKLLERDNIYFFKVR